MKVPLNWLRDYVDVTLPPAELAQKLTLAGFEVAEIIVIGGSWENIVIGRIAAVEPHPGADRLRLATVDLGAEKPTVVCGAPNLSIGDKVAFAKVGARLVNPYDGKTETLKAAKIRGVVSEGMICSEKELGISDSHEVIMVLSAEAPLGQPLASWLGDTVLDIDVTANRPDGLSVTGIAHEVAAICGQPMRLAEASYAEAGDPIEKQVTIEIADPDLCPRYSASLITGIKIAESPRWLQERLIAGGQRPISNIVDVTNYVMLEYGQPLHSFDYDRVKSRKVLVRRAREGEGVTTLDGVARDLTADTLVITDGQKAVAIAGVMGGANSDITAGTTNILLEAASFKAANIHSTSRRLGLTSEASTRFERGISPNLTIPALRRATQLIAELGGGKVDRGIIDVYPGKKEPTPITVTTEKVKRVLGIEYSSDQIVNALTALGIECRADGDRITATAPYWRSDIRIPVDLIEEVARVYGYDKIPTTLLAQPIPRPDPSPVVGLKKAVRCSLTGYGFQEVMTYTLTGLAALSNTAAEPHPPEPPPVHVVNPMTADQEYLRTGLRANLLVTLAANRRYEDGSLRLFELGKIFLRQGATELPAEPEIACGLLSGPRAGKSWHGGDGDFDFYDVKGIVEGLLAHLGVAAEFAAGTDDGLHPARQAAIVIKDKGKDVSIGVIGELHPKVAAAFELTGTIGLFEINVTHLASLATGARAYRPIPRFPSTDRDLALVVDEAVTHQQVSDIINGFPLVGAVALFDVYSGKQVAAGKKSLAYRIVHQSPDHTLTDEEVNRVQAQILKKLEKELGATLRT
jgi:phenylalanyl-tRNA synthetase beta chain